MHLKRRISKTINEEPKHGNTEQYDLNDFEEEKLIFVKLHVPLGDSLQNIKTIFNCLLCAYVYFMKNRNKMHVYNSLREY